MMGENFHFAQPGAALSLVLGACDSHKLQTMHLHAAPMRHRAQRPAVRASVLHLPWQVLDGCLVVSLDEMVKSMCTFFRGVDGWSVRLKSDIFRVEDPLWAEKCTA